VTEPNPPELAQQRASGLLVWFVIASQIAPPFMFSGVAVALPKLGADLGAGATALGLVESLFLAGSAALLLPVGRLADVTDKRRLFKLGLLIFGLLSLLIGATSSVPLVLFLRLLQGACSALLGATGPALLADLVPPDRRGRAYGASIGVIYVGLTIGPICAGLIVDAWSWRGVFYTGAAVLLAMYALIEWRLPSSWRRPEPGAVHGPSAVLIGSAVLALVFGSANMDQLRLGAGLLVLGLLLMVAFVILQLRLERPLVDIRALVGHRVMRGALLVQLLLYMSAFCSTFMLSIYMQVSLGHPAKTSGVMLAISAILMAVVAPISGALSDRLRPGLIAGLGVAMVLGSSLLATRLTQAASMVEVGTVLGLQGFGFALFSSPNMKTIMNSAAPHELAMVSALGAKARALGMVLGMVVTAVLVADRIGHDPVEQHAAEFVGVVTSGFGILAASTGLALIISIVSSLRRHESQ
jgi:MFS family permease